MEINLTCVRSSGKALKGMTVEIITERPEPSSEWKEKK